jgi:hypothetical protein
MPVWASGKREIWERKRASGKKKESPLEIPKKKKYTHLEPIKNSGLLPKKYA